MSQKINLVANKQFWELEKSVKSLRIFQGASRSGKTYSILQWLIYRLSGLDPNDHKYTVSIVRKTLPQHKMGAYKDFLDILHAWQMYDESQHTKADGNLKYILNGHTIQFFATGDNPDRLRSVSRDILYVNEVNELSKDEWFQLNVRTNVLSICDFNPSMPEHFIYNIIDNREKEVIEPVIEKEASAFGVKELGTDFFTSTFLDNNHLPLKLKKTLMDLKHTNPELWRVYGLGERARQSKGKIFSGWESVESFPDNCRYFYGLDFGWHPDPTALVKCAFEHDTLYVKQIMYNQKMEGRDIMRALKDDGCSQQRIWCDHNQEQIREELRRSHLNAIKGKKPAGSVVQGIQFLKNTKVMVVGESKDLWAEYGKYSWKLRRGGDPDNEQDWLQEPEDKHNHTLDAIRMAYYSEFFKGSSELIFL